MFFLIRGKLVAGVAIMAVSYNKLWKLLIDRKMNKTQLRNIAHISTNAVAKLGRDELVSMETIDKICIALKCDISDIMDMNYSDTAERD